MTQGSRKQVYISKKDITLKKYLTLASESEINLSRLAQCAVEYYNYTGEYLHLGTIADSITDEEKFPQGGRICMYFPPETKAAQILEERESQGLTSGKYIKKVLKGGITYGSHDQIISNREIEEAIDKMTQSTHKIVKEPHNQNVEAIKPENTNLTSSNTPSVQNDVVITSEKTEEFFHSKGEMTEEEIDNESFFKGTIVPGGGLGEII